MVIWRYLKGSCVIIGDVCDFIFVVQVQID